MRGRIPLLASVALLAAGCCHPIRTASQVTLTGPVSAQVTAEVRPATETGPLREAVVAGSGSARGGKIALIDVDGLLVGPDASSLVVQGEDPVSLFNEKLAAAAADADVRAVLLRINSTGGGVAASDIMWQELMQFRARTAKPVVACFLSTGTGGAYYLATAADAVFAYPTSVVGGIGVIFNHYNLMDAMQLHSITAQPIKAGNYIDMGSYLQPLPAEVKQWLQAMADEYHTRFKQVVAERRPRLRADDTSNFDGRVFTAREALSRGLIDQVGSLPDAIAAASQMSGMGCTTVIMYHRCQSTPRTPFAVAPTGIPLDELVPISIPGFDRSRLPLFLYLWQLDPTLARSDT